MDNLYIGGGIYEYRDKTLHLSVSSNQIDTIKQALIISKRKNIELLKLPDIPEHVRELLKEDNNRVTDIIRQINKSRVAVKEAVLEAGER